MARLIMVVDDEKEIQVLMTKILTIKGYDVCTAANRNEMWNILQERKVDMILLDVMLPDKNGFAICRELKQKPETAGIPVMLLTVLADPRFIQEGKSAGAEVYMTKPFELQDLEKELKRQLA